MNVKAVLTTRTHYRVLALLFGKSKIVLAGGASSVNVGIFVASFTLLQLKEFFRLIDNLNEFFVFLLPFVNIF